MIHGEKRRKEGEVEGKVAEESGEVQRRLENGGETEWARRCWGEIKATEGGRVQSRKSKEKFLKRKGSIGGVG